MTHAFNISLALYVIAFVAAALALTFRRPRLERISAALLGCGLVAQSAYIVMRWMAAGRPPFSNMFESLVLFAWSMVAVYLALRRRYPLPTLSAGTALMATVTLAYASAFHSAEIKPLVPALQSNWLTFHVLTCFLGYGAFLISFLTAIGYLVLLRQTKQGADGPLAALEAVELKSIAFGFLLLTVGIITGAVWANSAWGTYWSWDPKETWSLITWIIYAGYLHCRYMRGWKGKRTAWLSIVGFACVLFTYFGVNFVLSGLHSYAS